MYDLGCAVELVGVLHEGSEFVCESNLDTSLLIFYALHSFCETNRIPTLFDLLHLFCWHCEEVIKQVGYPKLLPFR